MMTVFSLHIYQGPLIRTVEVARYACFMSHMWRKIVFAPESPLVSTLI